MLPYVHSETFETLSTTTEDHYVFYPDIDLFNVYISERPPVVTWPSSLYHHVNYLLIEIPKISSIWNSLLTIGENKIPWFVQKNVSIAHNYMYFVHFVLNSFVLVRLNETSDNDAQQTVTILSHFVHLVSVTRVEFISGIDISQWKHIQFILQ
jgi:hypothetical protein